VRRTLLRLSLPFREPFVTASGVTTQREIALLRLEDDSGTRGYGEAAPFEPYDGVALDEVLEALRRGPTSAGPPQARAAEEMARLDLFARREARPVGEPGALAVVVNRTLSAGPPGEAAAHAALGARAGFQCFKLKVGLPDDEDRVRAVREAIGPWPALRVDANGSWGVDEAVAAIERLAAYDLEMVEQPCPSLEELAAVRRRVEVPITADESIASADDVRDAASVGACDLVNVKVSASGGVSGARAALREATAQGLGAFLSSTLDGPWGIAAALQLAASERLTVASGLATLELFDSPLARLVAPPAGGVMAVPPGPGLGVEVEPSALADAVVEELD